MNRLWASAAVVIASALSSAHAADAAHGSALYHAVCVSCHGDPPLGGPETATSPASLRNALNTVPAMSFLRNMYSDADLADIFAWLQSLRSNPPPVVPNIPGALSGLW